MLIKFAKAFDKFSCRCSDCVIVVGRDMQQTLQRRFNHKNVPNNVLIVAKKIAEIKNISLEEVINTTSSTARYLFDLDN